MARQALRVSAAGFFLLAFVGWLCGHSPFLCAKRAAMGAVGLYVLALVAGRIAISIMADAFVKAEAEKRREESGGERSSE